MQCLWYTYATNIIHYLSEIEIEWDILYFSWQPYPCDERKSRKGIQECCSSNKDYLPIRPWEWKVLPTALQYREQGIVHRICHTHVITFLHACQTLMVNSFIPRHLSLTVLLL